MQPVNLIVEIESFFESEAAKRLSASINHDMALVTALGPFCETEFFLSYSVHVLINFLWSKSSDGAAFSARPVS